VYAPTRPRGSSRRSHRAGLPSRSLSWAVVSRLPRVRLLFSFFRSAATWPDGAGAFPEVFLLLGLFGSSQSTLAAALCHSFVLPFLGRSHLSSVARGSVRDSAFTPGFCAPARDLPASRVRALVRGRVGARLLGRTSSIRTVTTFPLPPAFCFAAIGLAFAPPPRVCMFRALRLLPRAFSFLFLRRGCRTSRAPLSIVVSAIWVGAYARPRPCAFFCCGVRFGDSGVRPFIPRRQRLAQLFCPFRCASPGRRCGAPRSQSVFGQPIPRSRKRGTILCSPLSLAGASSSPGVQPAVDALCFALRGALPSCRRPGFPDRPVPPMPRRCARRLGAALFWPGASDCAQSSLFHVAAGARSARSPSARPTCRPAGEKPFDGHAFAATACTFFPSPLGVFHFSLASCPDPWRGARSLPLSRLRSLNTHLLHTLKTSPPCFRLFSRGGRLRCLRPSAPSSTKCSGSGDRCALTGPAVLTPVPTRCLRFLGGSCPRGCWPCPSLLLWLRFLPFKSPFALTARARFASTRSPLLPPAAPAPAPTLGANASDLCARPELWLARQLRARWWPASSILGLPPARWHLWDPSCAPFGARRRTRTSGCTPGRCWGFEFGLVVSLGPAHLDSAATPRGFGYGRRTPAACALQLVLEVCLTRLSLTGRHLPLLPGGISSAASARSQRPGRRHPALPTSLVCPHMGLCVFHPKSTSF